MKASAQGCPCMPWREQVSQGTKAFKKTQAFPQNYHCIYEEYKHYCPSTCIKGYWIQIVLMPPLVILSSGNAFLDTISCPT